MAKYFLDTEFHEHERLEGFFGFDKIPTIDLISIGIVSENGREFYEISKEFDIKAAWKNEWLQENVLMPLFNECFQRLSAYEKRHHAPKFSVSGLKYLVGRFGMSRKEIANTIVQFVYPETFQNFINARTEFFNRSREYGWAEDDDIQFYAYYADYDWVVFCWLFGRMVDLPKGFPMYCKDLKQMMDDRGLDKDWKRENCPNPEGEHNALVDAKWNLELYKQMQKIT